MIFKVNVKILRELTAPSPPSPTILIWNRPIVVLISIGMGVATSIVLIGILVKIGVLVHTLIRMRVIIGIIWVLWLKRCVLCSIRVSIGLLVVEAEIAWLALGMVGRHRIAPIWIIIGSFLLLTAASHFLFYYYYTLKASKNDLNIKKFLTLLADYP